MGTRNFFRKILFLKLKVVPGLINWPLMVLLLGVNLVGVKLVAQQVQAESPPADLHALDVSVCAPDGVALGGYDLVTYFTQSAPQVGLPEVSVEHGGLLYRFINQENRASFLKAPQQYLPSYRGWCSTNLSMGRLACPDYTNYKIEHGRLLFFERVGFTNGLDVWNSDPLLHRRQADQNFVLLSKPSAPTQP